MDLDKTAEPMNMHDRVTRESSGIPLFVSLFDFRRKGSNKLEILKLFLGSDI